VHTNKGEALSGAPSARHGLVPLWGKALLFACAYAVAAELGALLSVQRTFATFWPPAGLFVAVLLISERRDWPVLIGAGVLANLGLDVLHGRALLATLGFSFANALEALTAATLVGRLVGARPRLDRLREVIAFAAVGAILAPVVGATIGAAVVTATSPAATWWTAWYTWWIADVLGIVVVGSVILTAVGHIDRFRDRPKAAARRALRPVVRALLIAAPFAVLSYAVFAPAAGGTSWKFLTTPGLVACGIVGGPLGAAVSVSLVVLGGLYGMVSGAPVTSLVSAEVATGVWQAQAFFVVGGIITMALAAVIAEDRGHAHEARNAAERFRLLFDTMREGVAYSRMVYKDGRPVDWVYMQVNEAFGTMTGLHDVVGRHASDLVPGLDETNPELLEVYGDVARTGAPALFDSTVPAFGRTLRISVTSPARGDFLAVFEDATERVAEEKALADGKRRLEKMVYDVAEAMGSVVEARDPYTQGHQVQVALLAHRIARELGLTEEELDGISMAGLLHDIGKLRVPAEILTKPGTLSPIEFSLIREHPERGYEILNHIDFPWPVAATVRQHHERLDGSGYPAGLRGDDILLPARILGVADVVAAMASHRPYRPMVGLDQAIEEICTHPELYDERVVTALLNLHERGETGL
jgi:putative nucleotidyltransferase with HDIG domain